MNKHEIFASVLWAACIVALYKYGFRDMKVITFVGFSSVYAYFHMRAKGFRLSSVFAGLLGIVAAFSFLGFVWSIMELNKGVVLFGLVYMLSTAAICRMFKKVTA